MWRDGWVYYALVAWAPQSAGAADLDALAAGVVTSGKLAANLQQAVQKVTLEVPALTPAAAELLMARSEARVLEPDQAFRRSFDAVANAIARLEGRRGPGDGPAHRVVLRDLDLTRPDPACGLRRQGAEAPDDDPPGRPRDGLLMKAAVLRLPAPKRERLQVLYQKAVEGAVAS